MTSAATPNFDNVVIIGAGLAGLACAHALGPGTRIFEKEDEVGGMARSFHRHGFTFDMAGHWLHFAGASIRDFVQDLLDGELDTIERRAMVRSYARSTSYPFQAHTYGLPPRVIADCLLGYFAARESVREGKGFLHSFDDFINLHLGAGIAEHFMVPYNTKLWTVPPTELDWSWCERFVPTPTPEEVVLGALCPEGAGHNLGYNSRFHYPSSGGIGRLATRLHERSAARVEFAAQVERIDFRRKTARLMGGHMVPYGTLVSTLPLNELVRALVNAPENILATAAQLRAASVTYWDIGLRGENAPGDAHWTYFPEPNVPFYRVGSPSAASEAAAPKGCRSLSVELSHPQGTQAHVGDDDIVHALHLQGYLAANEKPLFLSRQCIPCAYVIMDHNYGTARKIILDWLREQSILSIGRYGSWTYDSMEGSLLEGRDTARRIAHGLLRAPAHFANELSDVKGSV